VPIAQNARVAAKPPNGGVRDVDKKAWNSGQAQSSWVGSHLSGRPNVSESDDRSARTESSAMTVHTTRLLTDKTASSLIESAACTSDHNSPSLTGDGLVRITESE
jgi:hypothetical protein